MDHVMQDDSAHDHDEGQRGSPFAEASTCVEDGILSSIIVKSSYDDNSNLNILADAALASPSPPATEAPVKSEEADGMQDVQPKQEPDEKPKLEQLDEPAASSPDPEVKPKQETPEVTPRPTTPQDPEPEVLGEDGDLFVHVGTNQHKRIFQVDAGLLRAASSKWRTLLKGIIGTWHLPTDDPQATYIALLIAYRETAKIPDNLSDSTLMHISQICSKYDLHKLLEVQVKVWAKSMGRRSLETRLSVSWEFGLRGKFEEAWKDLRLDTAFAGAVGKGTGKGKGRPKAKPGRKRKYALSEPALPKASSMRIAPATVKSEVDVDPDAVSELILVRAQEVREVMFDELSDSFRKMLGALLAGPAFTVNNKNDATDDEADHDPEDCVHHEQVLFNRLLLTARRKGLLSGTFPLTFAERLPFDTCTQTIEDFTNQIRMYVLKAGADAGYDCECVDILLAMVNKAVDEMLMLPDEIRRHFDGDAAEDVRSKDVEME